MKGDGRTHSTGNQTAKGQVCGVRELPRTDQLQVWEESGSREPEAAFLFTLKFEDAGNWKNIKTHQMSKKELEDNERSFITFVAIVACTISCCFSNAQEIQSKGKHHD
jgi:hypothetical protein